MSTSTLGAGEVGGQEPSVTLRSGSSVLSFCSLCVRNCGVSMRLVNINAIVR